ncbi:MAG: right-handed parallel beta-helix repeat-containing protein [Acidobacteria bacterium]|nr:right-handed parallel beta-helix repeat-containing protein [Acidobacteriota bacterium]
MQSQITQFSQPALPPSFLFNHASLLLFALLVSLLISNTGCRSTYPQPPIKVHTVVSSNDDNRLDSLRGVINQANQSAGDDVINFDLPPEATRISLTAPLPPIRSGITINGLNKAGGRIELDGTKAGDGAAGLKIIGTRNVIKNVVIHSFSGYGILLAKESASSGNNGLVPVTRRTMKSAEGLQRFPWENQLVGNFIGTDVSGTKNLHNQKGGIFVDQNATNVLIKDNCIAFNKGNGVSLPDGPNPPIGIFIHDNLIYRNSGLAIDLGNDGRTPNDAHVGDPSGPNHWQPFPELRLIKTVRGNTRQKRNQLFAAPSPATTLVTLQINLPRTDPHSEYTIVFYSCSCPLSCPDCTTACPGCMALCPNGANICQAHSQSPLPTITCRPVKVDMPPVIHQGQQGGLSFMQVVPLPPGFSGVIYAKASCDNFDTAELSDCVVIP